MPSSASLPHEYFAALRGAWSALRDHASMHRGIWIAAPVFWAAFAVFIHPVWGVAGFLIHVGACPPRRAVVAVTLVLSFPALALWFAAREPFLTLPTAPFHEAFIADTVTATRTGRVVGIPVPAARGFIFPFREEMNASGRRHTFRVTLVTPPGAGLPGTLRWGATGSLNGRAEPGDPPLNPGQLDMRRVLRGQGAAASLEAVAWTETKPPPVWRDALMSARAALAASLERHVPAPALPLLEASLLNITARVPPETAEAFRRSGMQHILAISGQHIGLMLAFLLLAALCIRLPRKAAYLMAALLTAAYIPMVGSPVSVVRSGLMLACILPGIFLERPGAGLHALCLTAAVDLLIDPHNILNLGFQLSYAATLALILGAGPARTWAGDGAGKVTAWMRKGADAEEGHSGKHGAGATWLQAALQMILLSALICLFTYPLLAASTHSTTPWGVIGNVATVPVGAAMLVGGLFTWCFDFLLPFGPFAIPGGFAGAAAGFCALLLEAMVFFLALLPGALHPIADAPAGWIAVLSAGCAVTTILLRRARYTAAALSAALFLAAEAGRSELQNLWTGGARITFLAVGHGDAALLELPGAVILIDAGDAPRVARNVIAPFLRHRGISRVDAVLITHPDRDHYGGASALLDLVPVGMVVGPPEPEAGSATWDCLHAKADEKGTPWIAGRAGQRVHAGKGISLWILAPDSTLAGTDKNDRSLVTLLRTPRGDVFFTGDVEQAGQHALAAGWPLWRGAWLKAPHHGSDRTTLPCFLHAAAPPRTVVSCGGRRGFPGTRTMETLAALGSPTAVTARHGAVTWTFGRRGFRESRHLDAPKRPL